MREACSPAFNCQTARNPVMTPPSSLSPSAIPKNRRRCFGKGVLELPCQSRSLTRLWLSERSAARLAHQSGGLGVPSSNLGAPTNNLLTYNEILHRGSLVASTRNGVGSNMEAGTVPTTVLVS